ARRAGCPPAVHQESQRRLAFCATIVRARARATRPMRAAAPLRGRLHRAARLPRAFVLLLKLPRSPRADESRASSGRALKLPPVRPAGARTIAASRRDRDPRRHERSRAAARLALRALARRREYR